MKVDLEDDAAPEAHKHRDGAVALVDRSHSTSRSALS